MTSNSLPIEFASSSLAPWSAFKGFFPEAQKLRGHFDQTFGTPLQADPSRFCWDYWSIPGQYRLLRTPASSFFPAPLFSKFLSHLTRFGREAYGCQMISHPWLSAYTDGCLQNFHTDVPHGPLSFVFSLTNWKKRSFSGGETLLARPKMLRYFSEYRSEESDEEGSLIESIPAEFNQLVVFDPRHPHGVRAVHGVDSILDSRLVIHGWFTDPRPMLEGSLGFKKILPPMDRFAEGVIGGVNRMGTYSGYLSLRLTIRESGTVDSIRVLHSNLVDETGQFAGKSALHRILKSTERSFPKSRGKTVLTLPLLFGR